MTHDDIIRMALEAGFEKYEPWSLYGVDELEWGGRGSKVTSNA
jgi:hypothetical protein